MFLDRVLIVGLFIRCWLGASVGQIVLSHVSLIGEGNSQYCIVWFTYIIIQYHSPSGTCCCYDCAKGFDTLYGITMTRMSSHEKDPD